MSQTKADLKLPPMKPSIFVPMIGQYENIGDIILRRPLTDWLRSLGTLHLFLGAAPAGYAEGLGVQAEDIVYQSFGSWYMAALAAATAGRAHYAFKPGEIQLSIAGLKEHLSVLPLIALIRLRGGKVVRIGSGARNFAPLPRALMKPSVWLSQMVMWRDAKTASYMGAGEVMPDLGFAEGPSLEKLLPRSERDALVVSMRGDRAQVSDVWIQAVQDYARERGLEIWVVTQVLRDSVLARSLTEKLGARLLDWDGRAHDQQEAKLRDLYGRTDLIVSDRLHVLITAYTHGAIPIGMLAYPSDKIERHFEAAGVPGVSLFTTGRSKEAVLADMQKMSVNRDVILAALPATRKRLEEVRRRLHLVLAPSTTRHT